jgi:inhibitor of KinA sporulation pathway (predicted exonuclease)
MTDAKPFKNHIVALDLEMNQPSGKIIQIGAVLGDLNSGEIVSRFSALVDPHEDLAQHISDLTGIQDAALKERGVDLHLAYHDLCAWLQPYRDTRQLNPLTWGGSDTKELRDQIGINQDLEAAEKDRAQHQRWPFGRRWLDVKTVYAAWRHAQGKPGDGGLARSMTKLGLSFQGRKHNAEDDAKKYFQDIFCAQESIYNNQIIAYV